jgi:hypothetical protein
LIKGFLSVPLFRRIVEEKNFDDVPQFGILKEIIQTEHNIPENYAGLAANVLRKSLEFIGIPFKEIKEYLTRIPKEELKPVSTVEEKLAPTTLEASSDYVKVGYLVGYLSAVPEMSKIEIQKILDDITKVVGTLPTLSKEVDTAKKLLDQGIADEKNLLKYMKNNFPKALELDFSIKFTETTKPTVTEVKTEKSKKEAPVT